MECPLTLTNYFSLIPETTVTTGLTTDVKSMATNAKDTSTQLIDTLPSSPRPVPMSITEDYNQYLEVFFKVFANGLNLREETTYSAFKSVQLYKIQLLIT